MTYMTCTKSHCKSVLNNSVEKGLYQYRLQLSCKTLGCQILVGGRSLIILLFTHKSMWKTHNLSTVDMTETDFNVYYYASHRLKIWIHLTKLFSLSVLVFNLTKEPQKP